MWECIPSGFSVDGLQTKISCHLVFPSAKSQIIYTVGLKVWVHLLALICCLPWVTDQLKYACVKGLRHHWLHLYLQARILQPKEKSTAEKLLFHNVIGLAVMCIKGVSNIPNRKKQTQMTLVLTYSKSYSYSKPHIL